jgi:hypothetical protein
MEKGNEVWYMEYTEPVDVRVIFNSSQGARYRPKFDLFVVQEVKWEKRDTVIAGTYIFFIK